MLTAEAGGRGAIVVVGWSNKQIQTSDRVDLTVVNVGLDGKHCDV